MFRRYSQPTKPRRVGGGGGWAGGSGRCLWKVLALGIVGYKKLFSSVRGLRVLIEKILPDLKIFYGFGLKQVPRCHLQESEQ